VCRNGAQCSYYLNCCPETIAALQAFRKRHADAQRVQAQYASQPTTVDIARYRSVLKNQAIVDEAEKHLRDFKPVTYDVATHIKAIDAFEAKAVSIQPSQNIWLSDYQAP
jgi:F-type H+-transporting ATPase subunit d